MVVRISHPLTGFLGGLFLKAMVFTDVFVTNLNGRPGDLHKNSSKVYTSIRHSKRQRTTFGMAYIADGPIGALRSLVQTYTQIPTAQSWVDFAAEYRRSILRQRPRLTAPTTVATVQSTLGYTFSNAQVLLDALHRGTSQCERLEYVGRRIWLRRFIGQRSIQLPRQRRCHWSNPQASAITFWRWSSWNLASTR
jgi:hypothetical protein